MSVLIVTMPNDYHAQAVKWAIQKLGGSCTVFYPFDLSGGAQWTLDPDDDVLRIAYRGERAELRFGDFESVWMRRPPSRFPQEHIVDPRERGSSEGECAMFAASVLTRLEAGRFTVSPIDATQRASLKPLQMRVAKELGLCLPKTITSNCSEDIIQFWEASGQQVVYKAIKPGIWPIGEHRYTGVPTTILSDTTLLCEDEVQKSPGIFQEVIDKIREVRVTVMGRSVFAWEKYFPARTGQDVDWRFMNAGCVQGPHNLPECVAKQCFDLMDALGLVFGCFDFALDKDGSYIFLEVNPQGNWLWGDEVAGHFQLESMAEFLISGKADFRYSGSGGLRLSDYGRADHDAAAEAEKERHYGDLLVSLYSSVSFHLIPPPEQALAG